MQSCQTIGTKKRYLERMYGGSKSRDVIVVLLVLGLLARCRGSTEQSARVPGIKQRHKSFIYSVEHLQQMIDILSA